MSRLGVEDRVQCGYRVGSPCAGRMGDAALGKQP